MSIAVEEVKDRAVELNKRQHVLVIIPQERHYFDAKIDNWYWKEHVKEQVERI